MADVFISYHEKSAGALVRRIASELEQEQVGISCWYAERDMIPGQFVNSIMNAIKDCKIFLLVLNQEANQSKYVFNELSNAYRRFEDGIIILPFQVGNFEVSDNVQFFLTTLHIINGGDSMTNVRTEELIQKIADSLQMPAEKADTPQLQSRTKITRLKLCNVVLIILLVFVLLAGALIFLVAYHPTWKVHDNTLTISGVGEMDYGSKFLRTILQIPSHYPPWYKYSATVTEVTIKDGVTNIGANAFDNFSRLTNVTIPNSVTSIEENAFFRCSRLKNLRISDNVTIIGTGAFWDCTSLQNIEISDNVRKISSYAFSACTSLRKVSVPATTKIDKYAFPLHTEITYYGQNGNSPG